MHLLVRETHSIDEQDQADDLGHAPADLVFLSFSDSDLATVASAWEGSPSLRLAPLARLRHPMSVDLYVERTIRGSGCVVVRLLGGLDYWRYGAEELSGACLRDGIPLALLPGDARDDPRLAGLSSVAPAALQRLDGFLRHGGPRNVAAALRLMTHLAGRGADPGEAPEPVPAAGVFRPAAPDGRPVATILFYRSHLMADELAPFEALASALEARGLAAELLYVSSLKEQEAAAFVASRLQSTRPRVVLNATFFSARRDGTGSPLDAAGVPVLQLVQAVGSEAAWSGSRRGLSQTDLAMQVVLPELDGRLLTTAISFKQADTSPGRAAFAPLRNVTHPPGVALAADRAAGWARLAATPASARRLGVVLSDYPAVGGQVAHAVGLDTLASLETVLGLLESAGYESGEALDAAELTQLLCHAPARAFLTLEAYRDLFATLPEGVRSATLAAWGEPAEDPSVRDGAFTVRHARSGRLVLAVQPDRGAATSRRAGYHDPDCPARHGYLAFHLWMRETMQVDAVLHLGAHGTLEWLPGKSAALSDACLPVALLRGLPVIYPFIVNNPGEAAAAKRRLGGVVIGHLTPPGAQAGLSGDAARLERLIEEYAEADGLDRRRGQMLRAELLELAASAGVLEESGVRPGDGDDAEALARLDAYLCDVKELQIRDGLHVFGRAPRPPQTLLAAMGASMPNASAAGLASSLAACAPAEAAALLAALDGRFVEPGPAGAPTRGRLDVLPTGRNLTSIDPRGVPTQSAMRLGAKAAAALLDRHRQEQGEWLRAVVVDLWGSTTLRTGGEDLALALVLMGATPVWDPGSGRVAGFEIVPLALLDRPRVDVTLRISGFFRDAFAGQIALFDQLVTALAARAEDPEWNALSEADPAPSRIFGAAPGTYGSGVEERLATGAWDDRAALGRAYLDGSGHAYGAGRDGMADAAGFASLVAAADALVHVQDHAETDLLEGLDTAAHIGGFAAAASLLGASPALYHADTARPELPRMRLAADQVARVVRGRAANPDWIAGMMRHGYRGATEIARALDALHGFAATLPTRFDRQFELMFTATLGDPAVDRFLRDVNPDARAAMTARFEEARRRGLWQPRSNSACVGIGSTSA